MCLHTSRRKLACCGEIPGERSLGHVVSEPSVSLMRKQAPRVTEKQGTWKFTSKAEVKDAKATYMNVYLGSLDLDYPYNYDGIADLVHLMLLSPGGRPIAQVLNTANRSSLIQKIKQSLSAVQSLGREQRVMIQVRIFVVIRG
jgi:hypothetical protein